MVQWDVGNSRKSPRGRGQWEAAIRRGTRWVLVAQIASQLVSVAVLAVLYRLITPDQFGLLGMVVPLLLLARILAAFGLNVATVQHQTLTDRQLTTVFWINLLLGCVAAGSLAGCAPLIAWFYRTPQLAMLVAALAGTLTVVALGAQHQALLERQLQIGRLVTARLIAQTAGGLAAVGAALCHGGVWALVLQQYVELTTLAVLVWYLEKWRPLRWSAGEPARELVKFGGYFSLSSLMFYVAQNADKLLIASLLGASQAGREALGLYSQAYNLMMKPVHLVTTPIASVMLPALARAAHQPRELQALVSRFFRMIALLLFPCGVGLTIVAVDLMLVLGDQPWRRGGVLLMVLAPTIVVQGLLNISGSIFAAAGKARALFGAAVATALVMTSAALIGYAAGWYIEQTPFGASLGVAMAVTAASVLVLAGPYLAFCFSAVQIPLRPVLSELLGPGLCAAAMGGLVALVAVLTSSLTPAPRLLVTVAVGVASYALLAQREIRWFIAHVSAQSE